MADENAREVPKVRLLGEATIRTEPDEALVWVSLTQLDSSAGKALSKVARRSVAARTSSRRRSRGR